MEMLYYVHGSCRNGSRDAETFCTFGMLNFAATDNIAHFLVVWRVQERHRRTGVAHQARQIVRLACIPTQQAVRSKMPKIAGLTHRSRVGPLGIEVVTRIGCILLEIDRQLVDFDWRKSRNR